MICLPHDGPRIGKLEQIKKEKFNLGCMQRREKGLIKNAAKYIDLLTGEVNGEVEVEYGFSAF